MEKLEQVIASNIARYRKLNKLTQQDLAEKLNFSDKSVSKWERGESVPDVIVLYNMCKIFGITLNDITSDRKTLKGEWYKKQNHTIIATISCGLVWLVATMLFVSNFVLGGWMDKPWLVFIYAIPATAIVGLVFACMWGKRWLRCVLISLILWSAILAVCLTFMYKIWDLWYIGIPAQVIIILWFMIKKEKHLHKTDDKVEIVDDKEQK